jgi:uncharacterized protein involved in exopolysaccharide biosynthesis
MDHEEIAASAVSFNVSENVIINKIFHQVIKKWWIFLIVGLIGAIIGFLYANEQDPVYESYLSFALDEGGSEGGASGAMGLAAQFGISIGGSQDVFTGDNILAIMQSRRVIERALLSADTFDNKPMILIEYYLQNTQQKNTEGNIHFYPGEIRSSFSYAKNAILYKTYLEFKNYHITARRPDKRLNIYELLVTSKFEEFSKVFTDKLIFETNSFYTEIRSKKSKETLEILEKRVPDMKGKLDATITSKAAIQDANLNTAFENAQIPLLKQESNAQVYAAAYAEMFKNLELARFQYLKSIPLMQVIDNADYPMKKIKMGKLKTAIIFSVIAAFIFLMIFIILNFFRFRTS